MSFSPSLMPLADLGETLRVVMPIIFVVIYGVAHLVGALQQEKKKRNERPRRQRPELDPNQLDELSRERANRQPPAAGRADAPRNQPATLEESLRREVEEFLKRAQGKQPQQPTAKRPTGPPRQGPAQPPREQVERPTRRLVEARTAPGRETIDSSQEGPTTMLPTGAAVDAAVAQQMRGASAIGQSAQRLGEEVALADDRMIAQLHEKFDHQVGTLAPATTAPRKVAASTAAAQEFRDLLTRPGGMRQVIIANEILRRPEERW